MNLAEIKAAAEAARRRYDKPDLQFARATEVLLLLDAQDWLLERVEELAEALNNEELKSGALRMAIDDGDDYGEHVGLQKYRCALLTGREEVLDTFRAALARLEDE